MKRSCPRTTSATNHLPCRALVQLHGPYCKSALNQSGPRPSSATNERSYIALVRLCGPQCKPAMSTHVVHSIWADGWKEVGNMYRVQNIIHPSSTDTTSHTVSSSTSPNLHPRVFETLIVWDCLFTVQTSSHHSMQRWHRSFLRMSCYFDPSSRQRQQGPPVCYKAYSGGKGGVTMYSVESVWARISVGDEHLVLNTFNTVSRALR